MQGLHTLELKLDFNNKKECDMKKEREMRHQKKMNLTLWATSNLTKNLENKKGKQKNKNILILITKDQIIILSDIHYSFYIYRFI